MSEPAFIHHVGLVARDMTKALDLYRRLGFVLPSPRYPTLPGPHGSRPVGAGNTHAYFSRNFIEIMVLVDDESALPAEAEFVPLEGAPAVIPKIRDMVEKTLAGLRTSAARFEGIHRLVLYSSNVRNAAERLTRECVAHGDVVETQRRIVEGGVTRIGKVSVVELTGDVKEGALALADAEMTPSDVPNHPNGAVDLIEAIVCVSEADLHDAVRRYEKFTGRAPRRDGASINFGLDGSNLVLTTEAGLEKMLPGEQPLALPALVAYAVAVADVVATRAYLEERGFEPRAAAGAGVFVPARAALGSAVVFREKL